MTPLHALLRRFLPYPLDLIALGIVYGAVMVAVIFCAIRPSQAFIYL
jgi:hypothetical protein